MLEVCKTAIGPVPSVQYTLLGANPDNVIAIFELISLSARSARDTSHARALEAAVDDVANL